MPIARFKDLCIDVSGPGPEPAFWAAVLGLRHEAPSDPAADPADAGKLVGERPEQTIWLNVVPEPKQVKNRVHIDVAAGSVADVVALGATQLTADGQFTWTTMGDPEGQEFCVFVRDPVPDYRFVELVVDCTDPLAQTAWWAQVLGATIGEGDGYGWIEHVPGLPFESIDFVPVPEPKTVKNRVHWDVTVDGPAGIDALVTAGATVVRRRDAEIRWNVLADPEGNEFCVFVP